MTGSRLDELEKEMIGLKSSMDSTQSGPEHGQESWRAALPEPTPAVDIDAELRSLDRPDSIPAQSIGNFEMSPSVSKPLIKWRALPESTLMTAGLTLWQLL